MKVDENAGVETQLRWLEMRERLMQLDEDAIDAARYLVDEEDVVRSIDRLEEALDKLISSVPAQFR